MIRHFYHHLELVSPFLAFSAIRAYVLCKSKVLAAVILILALAPAGANLVFVSMQILRLWTDCMTPLGKAPTGFGVYGVTDPMYGCLVLLNITPGMSLQYVHLFLAIPTAQSLIHMQM